MRRSISPRHARRSGLEVWSKSGFVAKIVSRREGKKPDAKSYPLIRRAFGDAAIADGWRFAAEVHFSARPLASVFVDHDRRARR